MEVNTHQEANHSLHGKDIKDPDEKHIPLEASDNDSASLENGHLQELEVDLDLVIKEQGLEDYDADHSPFPEGTFPLSSQPKQSLMDEISSCCHPKRRRPRNARKHITDVDPRHYLHNARLRHQPILQHALSLCNNCLPRR